MNAEDVKLIAQVVIKSQDAYEASWVASTDPNGNNFGHYALDEDDCMEQACEEFGLPAGLWYLLSLANHWSNDLRTWADDVVAGKDVDAEFAKDEASVDDSELSPGDDRDIEDMPAESEDKQ